MFDLIKLGLIAFGCIAVYGLATEADLNELFGDTIEHIVPVVKAITSGIMTFFKELFAAQ